MCQTVGIATPRTVAHQRILGFPVGRGADYYGPDWRWSALVREEWRGRASRRARLYCNGRQHAPKALSVDEGPSAGRWSALCRRQLGSRCMKTARAHRVECRWGEERTHAHTGVMYCVGLGSRDEEPRTKEAGGRSEDERPWRSPTSRWWDRRIPAARAWWVWAPRVRFAAAQSVVPAAADSDGRGHRPPEDPVLLAGVAPGQGPSELLAGASRLAAVTFSYQRSTAPLGGYPATEECPQIVSLALFVKSRAMPGWSTTAGGAPARRELEKEQAAQRTSRTQF